MIRNRTAILIIFYLAALCLPLRADTGDVELVASPAKPRLVKSVVRGFSAKETAGRGPLPYNYRVIDGKIHAGGSPFNPHYTNSDAETRRILAYLKDAGVRLILTVDSNPKAQRRLVPLLAEAGLEQLFIPMHAGKVPTKQETTRILKEFRRGGVYVHCTWGADRTGVVIGRYLTDLCGYSRRQAWKAVISGGSHAGAWGGFKRRPSYQNLLLWLWPDVKQDAPDVAGRYGL